MDGTLTVASHDFDKIRRQLGIPEGLPILEAIEKMPQDQASSMHSELHRLEMEIAEHSQPQPGAAEFLSSLQENGCKLGILTRNAEDIAHTTLNAAGLVEFFEPDKIIGRERCEPKPDPAGIHLHLTQWEYHCVNCRNGWRLFIRSSNRAQCRCDNGSLRTRGRFRMA